MRQVPRSGTKGATLSLGANQSTSLWRATGPWTIYVKGAATTPVDLEFRPDSTESWQTFSIDVAGTKTAQTFNGTTFADVQRYRFEEGEFRATSDNSGSPTIEVWIGGQAIIDPST